MKELVCSRFRNVKVVKTITSSEVKEADLGEVDFVVSSVDVGRSDIQWVTVNAIPTEEDFRKIEKMVQRCAYKESITEDTLTFFTDVLETVERYCIISKTGEFVSSLAECFARMGVKIRLEKLQPSLSDVLTKNLIRTDVTASTWEEAAEKAAGILVENGVATQELVESVVGTLKAAGPYAVISKGIALVHGKVGCGVIKMGMSMAVLSNPVCFYHPLNDPVKIVVCLAAADGYSHVAALRDLIRLLEQYGVDRISSGTEEQIFEMIRDTKDIEG